METSDNLLLMALTVAGTLAVLFLVARRRDLARGFRDLIAGPTRAVASGEVFRAWHVVALAFAVATLFACLNHDAARSGLPFLLAVAGLFVLFAMSWTREVLLLMSLRDEDLPGRFDKPIWAFFLVALPPIGVLLFRSHRLAHWPEPRAKAAEMAARTARELA